MSNKDYQILIIEDQKSIADELKQELEAYAEIISVSGSPDRGLLRAKAYPYNCFIVNCGHDGKQGRIFIDRLKKQQDLHDIPVLFTYKPGAKFDIQLVNMGIKFEIIRLPFDKNEFQWRFKKVTGIADEVKTEKPENKEKESIAASNPSKRVMLVEDNPLNQKVLGMFISKLGFEFDVASNGQMAIDLFLQNQYKFILMDIFMPGMDGTEATVKIRELEKDKEHKVKIIAISANESEDGIKKCYDSGMNDYLVKPFTLEILREKLV